MFHFPHLQTGDNINPTSQGTTEILLNAVCRVPCCSKNVHCVHARPILRNLPLVFSCQVDMVCRETSSIITAPWEVLLPNLSFLFPVALQMCFAPGLLWQDGCSGGSDFLSVMVVFRRTSSFISFIHSCVHSTSVFDSSLYARQRA